MGGSRGPLDISPRRRAILMAIQPIGIGLLVAWVAWIGVLLATGAGPLPVASGVIGLVTALVLTWSGTLYRRDLRDD